MKVGEFARHARAFRLSKKAKFEAAFERDLRLLDAASPLSPSPIIGFAHRRKAKRPLLTLATQDQTPRQKEA